MKKYDWKNEYNPIRRTAKRLLSGEALTDGRPLSDIVNIGLHFFLKNVRPYAASCSEA